MSWLDGYALGVGALLGGCVGALYFAGLAFGIRIALHAPRPTTVLLLSALVRMALLLGVGAFVLKANHSAFAGYCLAFLALRLITLGAARYRLTSRPQDECEQWN